MKTKLDTVKEKIEKMPDSSVKSKILEDIKIKQKTKTITK
jgi:hypothetical protein